jgi:hypothetical protein
MIRDFIQQAPTTVFLVMLAIAGAFVAIPLYAAWQSLIQMRALKALPRTRIVDAHHGYVRVEGKAEPTSEGPLRAPLTHAECIWYSARVERWVHGAGKRDGRWDEIRDEESEALFVVRDASGAALVDPADAEVVPTDRSLWYGASEEPEHRNPKRFSPGENPKGELIQVEVAGTPGHRYRYHEERIYVGDAIFVQGDVGHEPATDERPHDRGAARRIISAPAESARPYMVASAAPGTMAAIHRSAVQGALFVAAFGAGLVAALLWLRYG